MSARDDLSGSVLLLVCEKTRNSVSCDNFHKGQRQNKSHKKGTNGLGKVFTKDMAI